MSNLLVGLGRIGWPVRVLALGPGSVHGTPPPYELRVSAGRPRPAWHGISSLFLGRPPSLTRWRVPKLAVEVREELETWRPDVVHLEQLQLAWLLPFLEGRVPVVLRQQNVESRILERLAAVKRGPLAWFLHWEAQRVKAIEAAACRRANVLAPISQIDAASFLQWVPRHRIVVVSAPFMAESPRPGPAADGHPALLCLGSLDWAPNRDGAQWFLRKVWPLVRRELTGAVLHLAGPGSRELVRHDGAIRVHGVVDNPLELYGDGTIAVVPVRAGSGVRLRILEAWNAGAPVVTTRVGAEGLASGPDEGVVVADDARSMAVAVVRLARDQDARSRLVAAGSKRLEEHTPLRVATQAAHAYRLAREVFEGQA